MKTSMKILGRDSNWYIRSHHYLNLLFLMKSFYDSYESLLTRLFQQIVQVFYVYPT
jgi:intergrase/recombinase